MGEMGKDRIPLKQFLRNEVKPALGCTEPAAVALAVARACDELTDRDQVASVRVTVGANIYKNGMAVGIPGTKGARGNAIAAALGAICGRASFGLEVLSACTDRDVQKAERWVEEGRCTIYCDPDRGGVYVMATVFTPTQKSVCCVEGTHSHIAEVLVDGVSVYKDDAGSGMVSNASGYEDDGFPETLLEALELAEDIDDEDRAFLLEGARMNMLVAEAGMEKPETCMACGQCAQGSRFGRTLFDFSDVEGGPDIALKIRAICAAAADARMSGVQMAVMSSAGSGNHGIATILPVEVYGRHLGLGDAEIARAIAISHIGTSFVKRRLGRLSSVCGCSIAAGAGAAAGLTALQSGTPDQIANAMTLLLSNLAGMLCDGAKESCALKVSSAAAEAYFASRWAMADECFVMPQGVVGASLEETAGNVGRITKEAMKTVDHVMIDILDQRHRPVI